MDQKTPPRKDSSGAETEAETVASGSEDLVDILVKNGISLKGNGQDQELSRSELGLINELYDRVAPYREALPEYDHDWCDKECVRRYLVARSWSLEKAEAQLVDTLQWRAKEQPAAKEFWQVTKASANPWALAMRIVGWDLGGRPVGYSRFSESNDRWDSELSLEHIMLLMEASGQLIRRRQQRGLNQTADTRQITWVIDFDGFGFRDQNPRTALMTAALLQHYPEMLHMVVLVDAPMVFNALWRLVAPLLDDRVRSKILFVKGKQADSLLRERLGAEAAQWVANETKDSAEQKRVKGIHQKKYWIPPKKEGQHDSRGFPSYLKSDLYIKTPGDGYEEARQGKASPKPLVKPQDIEEETLPITKPCFTKTIYSGTF